MVLHLSMPVGLNLASLLVLSPMAKPSRYPLDPKTCVVFFNSPDCLYLPLPVHS